MRPRPNALRPGTRGQLRAVSVAPMMDRTDRHFRYLMRQLTRRALLYTEMLTTGAVIHGDRQQLLGFDPAEHPVALQLGGDDPSALAEAARIGVDWGYDEINLNVGCPSARVQSGCFGAALMARPERVAEAVRAMRAAVSVPVTVKHRIGIDAIDRYEDMARFVSIVADAGCDRFSVHARKAWLEGLSPKENRTVPPLRYADVYRLADERPELAIEINGGITDADQMADHLARVDAVMIGRAAYETPWVLAEVDPRFFGEPAPAPDRHAVAEAMLPYIERHVSAGGRLHHVSRHMLTLFAGCRGAKAWKRTISELAPPAGAGAEVIALALSRVPRTSPPTSEDAPWRTWTWTTPESTTRPTAKAGPPSC
ncbi:MAG: tRNA dihydrouridine(20/20a) synthase DusA [Deltaproteobacteria bacterium]|nr:tRNA dihydrouridine(20/20a) synthase DusA [Deltaproteobacteria bacterium]